MEPHEDFEMDKTTSTIYVISYLIYQNLNYLVVF